MIRAFANILLAGLLALSSCSRHHPDMSARLEKYAKDKNILYITEFPIYFQVEVIETNETRTALETLLKREGFRKTPDAAYGMDGKLVSQTFRFGDTFEMDLSSAGGRAALCGYGITNSEHDVGPVLRRILQEIDGKYQVKRRELKGLK
jgi:hypothetical protein